VRTVLRDCGALGLGESGEERVQVRDRALLESPLPDRRKDHGAEPLAISVGRCHRASAVGDLGVELGQPHLGGALEGVVRPQRRCGRSCSTPNLVLQRGDRGGLRPARTFDKPRHAVVVAEPGVGDVGRAARSLLRRDAAVGAMASGGRAIVATSPEPVSVGFPLGSIFGESRTRMTQPADQQRCGAGGVRTHDLRG
jgi:hypothetical protein